MAISGMVYVLWCTYGYGWIYTVLPNVYLYYYICYYTTDVTTLVVSLTDQFLILRQFCTVFPASVAPNKVHLLLRSSYRSSGLKRKWNITNFNRNFTDFGRLENWFQCRFVFLILVELFVWNQIIIYQFHCGFCCRVSLYLDVGPPDFFLHSPWNWSCEWCLEQYFGRVGAPTRKWAFDICAQRFWRAAFVFTTEASGAFIRTVI